jgi:hypothetical protein
MGEWERIGVKAWLHSKVHQSRYYEKCRLLGDLAEIPPGLSPADAREAVNRVTRWLGQFSRAEQVEIREAMTERVLGGDFNGARDALLAIPNDRFRPRRLVRAAVLVAGSLALRGWAAWLLRGVLLKEGVPLLVDGLLGRPFLRSETGYDTGHIHRVTWIHARLLVGDGASALAEYRTLRSIREASPLEDNSVLVALQLNPLRYLARYEAEAMPVAELADDVIALSELEPASRATWTLQAIDGLLPRLEKSDPDLAKRVRVVRALVSEAIRDDVES